jgi:tetratricopeptide (TPR) repeat protein
MPRIRRPRFLGGSGFFHAKAADVIGRAHAMTVRRLFLILYFSIFMLSASLRGEQAGNKTLPLETESERLVAGRILTTDGSPARDTKIEITTESGDSCCVIRTGNESEFQADAHSCVRDKEPQRLTLTLHVSRKGFQHAHKLVEKKVFTPVTGVTVTLRPLQQTNPALLSHGDLTSALSPRLRQLDSDDSLPVQDQKDYAEGVREFLGFSQLDKAVLLLNRAATSNPSCRKCKTMLALAELQWGDWDDARAELEGLVQAARKDKNPAYAEALILYGVLLSWESDYAKAGSYFVEALEHKPQDAFALHELGRSQYMYGSWEAASVSLRQALAAGAGNEARLLLAETLLRMGKAEAANTELTTYLAGGNVRSAPQRVRSLSESIRNRMNQDAAAATASAKSRTAAVKPIDYINNMPADLPDFEPAADQEPLNGILSAVGEYVSRFFANLLNVSAEEEVQMEKLNAEGRPTSSKKSGYLYLCLGEPEDRTPTLHEFRSDQKGNEISITGLDEGYMLTAGFVSAPMLFHPAQQRGSSFRLLGYQKLNGRDAIVIAYAQIPGQARIFGTFRSGKNIGTTFKQGIAWIDKENYQVLRLVSDLLVPLPQVKLEKLSTQIDFAEFSLDDMNEKLRMPAHVVVTVHSNGKALRNTHSYSDFKLFSVEASQKIAKPKGEDILMENADSPLK